MYHNIAALDEQAIDRMLQPYAHLMTEAERADYKDNLLEIVGHTQEFISKFEQSPGRSL